MLLGKIQYCMPVTLEDDGHMIPYNLLTFDVVKCAPTSLFIFNTSCFGILILPFWKIRCVSALNSYMTEPIRFKFLPKKFWCWSWSYSHRSFIPVVILLRSRLYFDPDSSSIPILSWSRFCFYAGCISISIVLLFQFYLDSDLASIPALFRLWSGLYPGSISIPILFLRWILPGSHRASISVLFWFWSCSYPAL